MFSFGRKLKVERGIKEIQTWIIAEAMKFAAIISEAFDKDLNGASTIRYRRLVTSDPNAPPDTDLNQVVLVLEALCFFLHALSRVTFRRDDEKLRELVFDPSVFTLTDLFYDMLHSISNKAHDEISKQDILQQISIREYEYSAAVSLIGENGDDRNSAVWLAAVRITEEADHPKNLLFAMQTKVKLMQGLVNMNLPLLVSNISKNI